MRSILQWLWKQKYRIDRGYQVVGMINLVLLLAQSQKLAGLLCLSLSSFVLLGLPAVVLIVWFCGYLISHPVAQIAEDRAIAEVSVMRRDLDEVLRLLRKREREKEMKGICAKCFAVEVELFAPPCPDPSQKEGGMYHCDCGIMCLPGMPHAWFCRVCLGEVAK